MPGEGQAPALPPIAESRAAKGKQAMQAERPQSCLDGLWGLLSQAPVLHASCPAALAQALQLLLALCEVQFLATKFSDKLLLFPGRLMNAVS